MEVEELVEICLFDDLVEDLPCNHVVDLSYLLLSYNMELQCELPDLKFIDIKLHAILFSKTRQSENAMHGATETDQDVLLVIKGLLLAKFESFQQVYHVALAGGDMRNVVFS